jgi:hypothetical protein
VFMLKEDKPKLPYGDAYKTVEEVKAEIIARGHGMPSDEAWQRDKVVSGIGIYDVKKGILHYWLIGVSDEEAGR